MVLTSSGGVWPCLAAGTATAQLVAPSSLTQIPASDPRIQLWARKGTVNALAASPVPHASRSFVNDDIQPRATDRHLRVSITSCAATTHANRDLGRTRKAAHHVLGRYGLGAPRATAPAAQVTLTHGPTGFKKNVNRATTQVMMKTGHVEKTNDRDYEVEERWGNTQSPNEPNKHGEKRGG